MTIANRQPFQKETHGATSLTLVTMTLIGRSKDIVEYGSSVE